MKILIVDDNPDAIAVARQRLSKEGMEIASAEGGIAGLDAARREKPDLILLDVDMPDMPGYDVCRALKADPDLCMIPVIFLSGSATPDDKVTGLDVGAVDYVTKPFDAFELRARVRAAVRTKHLQDLLIEHAHIDPLTGLPNRRALMARLQHEWARMERNGGSLSLIMADVDHFKRVNDTYGHLIGDRLLQEIAKTLAGQCRTTDLPSRYGGEEFAIVVPDQTVSNAIYLAERCRQEVERIRLPVKSDIIRATVSLGVADSSAATTPESLIDQADDALYQAKNAGRNRVLPNPESPSPLPVVDLAANSSHVAQTPTG
jgi:two-component system, cell cycle response regulator